MRLADDGGGGGDVELLITGLGVMLRGEGGGEGRGEGGGNRGGET